jgi:hypothetical protein
MKTVKEYRWFDVIAGMPFGSMDYKMRVVGKRKVCFEYLIHPDGDKQLVKEYEVKRISKDK